MLVQQIFAKNLKDAMRKKDFTQSDLASATGLCRSSICQYLSGQNMPGDRALNRIAKALETDIESLLSTDDEDVSFAETNMKISTAAKLMGVSTEFVRSGIRQNRLPFGTAVKVRGNRYTYYISPVKFSEYTGIDLQGGGRKCLKSI